MPYRLPTHGQRVKARRPAFRQHEPRSARRPSPAKQGYGRRWRKARRLYLREHPLCVQCEAEGTIMAATVVDHVVPHRGDYNLFWDESNWQAMCKPCHDRKTGREDGGFGNRASDT